MPVALTRLPCPWRPRVRSRPRHDRRRGAMARGPSARLLMPARPVCSRWPSPETETAVADRMGQLDSAQFLTKLFHHGCDVVGGRSHRAVDQREPVLLLDQVAVHRKHQRIPGQLSQLRAVAGYLHSSPNRRCASRVLYICARRSPPGSAAAQVIAGTLGSSSMAASILDWESSTSSSLPAKYASYADISKWPCPDSPNRIVRFSPASRAAAAS